MSSGPFRLGIRMALGAPASGVLRMVIGQGMILAGTGAAIGLALALALGQFTVSLLYGIGATDAVTFIGGGAAAQSLADAWC